MDAIDRGDSVHGHDSGPCDAPSTARDRPDYRRNAIAMSMNSSLLAMQQSLESTVQTMTDSLPNIPEPATGDDRRDERAAKRHGPDTDDPNQ